MLRALAALIAGAWVFVASDAPAVPLVYEPFDYAEGESLAQAAGGSGWAGPWQAADDGSVIVANSALLREVPAFGTAVALSGNTRVRRHLDTSPGGPFGVAGLLDAGRVGKAGAVLYIGFMQRVSVVPVVDGGDSAYLRFYSLELNTGDADTTRVLEVGHDDRSNPPAGSYYGVASVTNNGLQSVEPGQFRSLGNQDTTWNTIVVKITFGAPGNDIVQVLRNPESRTSESASTVDATLTGTFRFDRIALARYVGNTPVHMVDEIRLATEYSEAFTPVDEARARRLVAEAEERARLLGSEIRSDLLALAAKGLDTSAWNRELGAVAASHKKASPWDRLYALAQLAQSLALAGVNLGVDRLLFVKRHMFKPTHIYTEHCDGPYRPGGGLFLLAPVHPRGTVTELFDAKGGIVRDPDVSFDGERVMFAYRPRQDGYYHIHEMRLDGTGLRQITDGPYHDLDPFHRPDGRIGFTSTRCKSRALCFWVQAATLFAMDSDGTDIRPLSANNVSEFTPQMLPDGRILYTRWEYMDKSAIFVQSLWSTSPDGTRARQVYGNNLIHPVSLLQARAVPGSCRITCVLGAHNGDSVGPLALVEPALGVDNIDAILDLTPECDYHQGCFAPFPVSDKWCLVSYGPAEPFGIYAFKIAPPVESVTPRKADVPLQVPQHPRGLSRYFRHAVGARHLVYRDDTYSCVEAMPVAARPRPPVVAPAVPVVEAETDEATLVLVDVYAGLGDAVPRGEISFLRVVEEMGHRDPQGRRNYEGAFDEGQFRRKHGGGFMSLYASPWESGKPAPSLQAKHVYGTVPVEPDGSAYFVVPAGRPVYFQALDAQYNEIQRMRSYIHLAPGERQSCIGCHESRATAPPTSAGRPPPMALRRPPSRIRPPPFGPGPFSYRKLVQPILDKHCMSCHSTGKPAGRVDLSATRDARNVPASYATLVRPRTAPERPPLVHFFDNWWGTSTTVPVAIPLSFGARASRLIEMIDRRHDGVDLPEPDRQQIALSSLERRIITTWIDLNCPLWDSYSPELHARAEIK